MNLANRRTKRIRDKFLAVLLAVAMAMPMMPASVAMADNTSSQLINFINGATLGGENIVVEGDTWKTVKPGVTYDMSLSFKEGTLQFVEDATQMTYTLPAGVTASGGGKIDITVTTASETYIVRGNDFTVSPDGKTLGLVLNTSDESLKELNKTSNAQFSLNFKAEFTLDNGNHELDFGNGIKKTVTASDSHNAKVSKSGWFSAEDGKMHYTVTVSSEGISKNIQVSDVFQGDGLKLDKDSVKVSDSSLNFTVDSTSDTGFTATIAELGNGKSTYIEYTASVDAGKVGENGKLASQGNEVSVSCENDSEGGDNKTTYNSGELTLTSIQNKSGAAVTGADGYAEIDSENRASIRWTILLNNEKLLPLNGKAILDTLEDGQKYSGTGITVKKTDRAGNTTTETLSWAQLTAASDTSWTYTPTDETAYSYEISYMTTVDAGSRLSDLTVKNKVQYPYGERNGQATVGINPDNKLTIQKTAESVSTDQIEWNISVNVPATGYSSLVVKDTYPKQWISSGEVTEGLLSGAASVTVNGITGAEAYTLDTSDAGYFTLTFYKDTAKTTPGLLATSASRTVTVKVVTKVNPDWLDFAQSNTWAAGHTNNVDVTADAVTQSAGATAYPTNSKISKNMTGGVRYAEDASGNKYPYYQYEIIVSPLTIPETTIDYPVVQRDNEYYLEHDFDGKVNAHGAIFLDEQCQSTEDALIIHGHHMKDGTMFSGLKDYKKEEFRESHREARVYLEQEERQYYFFAAAKVDLQEEDPFAYTALPTSKEAWQDYLNTLRYRAFWYEEPQNAADGRILILSTCDYDTENERLVLFGVSGKDPKISE